MAKSEKHLNYIMFGIFILIIAAWLTSAPIIFKLFGCPESPGEVGDVFGAIGALFSGLAFCGVIWAIILQRKELQLQHQELKATLDEMKQKRKANEQSADMLEMQANLTRIQILADIIRTIIDTVVASHGSTFHRSLRDKLEKNYDTIVDYIQELLKIKVQLDNFE